jgi:hypothetical protein
MLPQVPRKPDGSNNHYRKMPSSTCWPLSAGPDPSKWAVWLAGQLPREHVAAALADLQDTSPKLYYAISLLWSFMESWISPRWELNPQPSFRDIEEQNAL